jgi:hypothetical protein
MHRLTLGYAEKTEASTYVTPMIVDRDKSAARSSGVIGDEKQTGVGRQLEF